jgi:hypothetical protein
MKIKWLYLCLGLMAASPASFAEDDDDIFDEIIPEDCIQVRAIKDTDIVDDQTILFYMRGDKIYRNNLDHKCRGLKREESFMYEVNTSRLCDIDIIKVVDGFNDIRSNGLRTQMVGTSCFLGKFYPISEEMADILKNGEPQPKPPKDETGSATKAG